MTYKCNWQTPLKCTFFQKVPTTTWWTFFFREIRMTFLKAVSVKVTLRIIFDELMKIHFQRICRWKSSFWKSIKHDEHVEPKGDANFKARTKSYATLVEYHQATPKFVGPGICVVCKEVKYCFLNFFWRLLWPSNVLEKMEFIGFP